MGVVVKWCDGYSLLTNHAYMPFPLQAIGQTPVRRYDVPNRHLHTPGGNDDIVC